MATRTARCACPHDCPDTCAMHVEVDESGRAVSIGGDPDHPITVGFLCGKVSNYLDRVYAEDRILTPLIRTGAKGSAEFREASWDEALGLVAEGLGRARDEHGGESILPYSYMGTQGTVQGELMGTRLMNALGGSNLERTICASAGINGVLLTQGLSSEVDPEEWPNARYLLVWGWNPMSTAPHLWRKLLDARSAGAKLVVIDPFRSRSANAADEHLQPIPGTDAALALGMMRAVVDAGLADEEWCRAHTVGFDELLERLGEHSVEHWAGICGIGAETIERIAREFASTQPALLRLGVGAQRHKGAPIAYRTIACLPALVGAWRHRGGGCSYIPTQTAAAVSQAPHLREDLRPDGEGRMINMSQLGQALTDPDLEPPVKALIVWNSNPAQIAPDQLRVLDGLAREDLFTVVIEQFMTDTAAHADVVLPATTQLEHDDIVFSWGHQYQTLNEAAIEPLGEAKPNSEIFRLIARRMGFSDGFEETDFDLIEALLSTAQGGITLEGLRERGWQKVDHGRGPLPHAEGGFLTASGKLEFSSGPLAEAGIDPLPFYDEPAEAAGVGEGEYPLALVTPKTHLFLNSTFANQERQHSAQPAPGLIINPADAAARGISEGAMVRVFNDRGEFACPARVSEETRAGVLVAPMGWWGKDWQRGIACQATTSQELTALGNAPIFNDNRVEAAPI